MNGMHFFKSFFFGIGQLRISEIQICKMGFSRISRNVCSVQRKKVWIVFIVRLVTMPTELRDRTQLPISFLTDFDNKSISKFLLNRLAKTFHRSEKRFLV